MRSRSADREGVALHAPLGVAALLLGTWMMRGDEAAMKKLIYRLASFGLSVVSGMLAGAMFKQLWKLIAREDEAPEATDPERSWREVLPAAALQGAVFATVKAAVERSAVQGGRKLARSSPEG